MNVSDMEENKEGINFKTVLGFSNLTLRELRQIGWTYSYIRKFRDISFKRVSNKQVHSIVNKKVIKLPYKLEKKWFVRGSFAKHERGWLLYEASVTFENIQFVDF